MHVLSVVGARPQFVKAAEFALACSELGVRHAILHTGQHYDDVLSRRFFQELEIPEPVENLEVGSGTHARQTGEMMRRLDGFLNRLDRAPDWVVVYGDTNSTLAASLVAAKRGLPIAHVEAGLRSYDRGMPEELNRVMTDRISNVLFCPTDDAVANLRKEGIERGVHLTGDVMYDSLLRHKESAVRLHGSPFGGKPYNLATIHRAENTDDAARLKKALACLKTSHIPILWPMHPRTESRLAGFGFQLPGNVMKIQPVGYMEMLGLMAAAERIVTDSGGVQKEAFWLGTPCITLRSTTEWPETLVGGWNVLVDVDVERFEAAMAAAPSSERDIPQDGQAAVRMVKILEAT